MKFEVAIFIIGVCFIISLVDAKKAKTTGDTCVIPQCFDCTLCDVDCDTVENDCDSECLIKVRKFVCQLEKEHCINVGGCNIPSTNIQIYPAANYDTSNPVWAPKTIEMRPNCCYNLNNPAWNPWYDNTLSSLKTQGACVVLFDGLDCTGTSLTVDNTWTANQLKWIDDPSRTGPPTNGILFNDKTSSMRLC